MDGNRFDALAKLFGEPTTRRLAVRSLSGGSFGVVLGLLGLGETEARKKKKKKCSGSRKCGKACCGKGTFCCDDARKVCCTNSSECCNVGPGTGSCCAPPNRCGKPTDNDAAPSECCPPERQWFTTTGLVRCCPTGTRSMGTGVTADGGRCCPEEKYCSQSVSGGTCCGDNAPICANPATGQCCTEETRCGNLCCPAGTTCCGEGAIRACCAEGLECRTPCGNLDAACCPPEAVNCCNTL